MDSLVAYLADLQSLLNDAKRDLPTDAYICFDSNGSWLLTNKFCEDA